jgi:2-keto-4-pentenoate hydratase/2-oxohepta-3-ene-1,7-dioic acid hydratase in catechol pathway
MPDTGNLGLKLWVNDTLMQDSSTSQIIFNDAELVSFMSQRVTLFPGDVIITGTPAGVGTPRGIFLKAGDVVRCEVQGVGSLVNTMA